MKAIKLNAIEQFKNLKKGDFIIVKWNDYSIKHSESKKKIMPYRIYQNKSNCSEIICRLKDNHYFNYELFLSGKSGAEEVILIEEIKQ